jgi:hypothetical protein
MQFGERARCELLEAKPQARMPAEAKLGFIVSEGRRGASLPPRLE